MNRLRHNGDVAVMVAATAAVVALPVSGGRPGVCMVERS